MILPIGVIAVFTAIDLPVTVAFGTLRRAYVLQLTGDNALRKTVPQFAMAFAGAVLDLSVLIASEAWAPRMHPATILAAPINGFIATKVALHYAQYWSNWTGGGGLPGMRKRLKRLRDWTQLPRTAPGNAPRPSRQAS